MLLHANKKNNAQEPIKNIKRTRPPALSIAKIKLKVIDSPTFRPELMRAPIYDSLQLRCEGMKLNARDLKSPEKSKKKISGRVSKTVTLLKPLLSIAHAPIFSSLQLTNNTFFPRFSENPEELKPKKQITSIQSTDLLLTHDAKKANHKEKIAYYTKLQRYASLHAWREQRAIPKIEGVLQSQGVCELEHGKYFVSDIELGYTFKNLMTEFGKMQECTARFFLRQLISTVGKLHAQGFIHGRLNIDSIMHDCQGHLLINYFKSSSQPVGEGERQIYLYYFSPEMLASKAEHSSFKNDIWAIGCIALQFLSGRSLKTSKHHPYNNLAMNESQFKSSIFIQKLMGKIKDNWHGDNAGEEFSSDAMDLISRCLQVHEENRPTIDELLFHPFLQQVEQ